ncbi:glycosyltransferase [Rubripirellula amarantea]|nr:glycosyltransferase [Rubripirellula amarantea]MDA8745361.1 glycosyltransferase [Rubripirellula amarantea]
MPVGGAETLLVNMMRRMDSKVVEPEVVCLKEPGPLGEAISGEFPLHSHLIGGKYDVLVVWKLARLFHQRRIDAVITVGAGDKMFWGRLAAAVAGVPVIASALHSTGWPDGVGRLNRTLTCVTDAFIGVADSHGEFLRDFEKFPAGKVNVIRNGVDCDRFHPDPDARASLRRELGLSEATPVVGIVAALRHEKNHTMLVRAAKLIAEKETHKPTSEQTHWVIVGDGPERETIESLATELDIANRIHLLGTRHDTDKIVAGLDVFTLCSLNEASPVSILEALASEVPVVATDVGSVKESVIADQTGTLIPSEDVNAMAMSIERMLANPASRQAMGKRGRQLVLETGSLESMVAGYQQLITTQYDRQLSASSAATITVPRVRTQATLRSD